VAQTEERIRAFLAVELDDNVRPAIGDLVRRLSRKLPNVSWTRLENVHLTLRFLGDVTPAFIEDYVAKLRPVTEPMIPLAGTVGGVGAFPNARRPSVIWIGMQFQDVGIQSMQAEVERLARDAGLAGETRRFAPHVTIGRVRRGRPHVDVSPILEHEASFAAGAMTVDAVSLFSSKLTPQGAQYTRLHRLTFDGLRSESGL